MMHVHRSLQATLCSLVRDDAFSILEMQFLRQARIPSSRDQDVSDSAATADDTSTELANRMTMTALTTFVPTEK
jgi:hypothetical protein